MTEQSPTAPPTEQEIARAGLLGGAEMELWLADRAYVQLPPSSARRIIAALFLLRPIAEGTHGRVPLEPTEAMIEAANRESWKYQSSNRTIYRAMLAAAKEAGK